MEKHKTQSVKINGKKAKLDYMGARSLQNAGRFLKFIGQNINLRNENMNYSRLKYECVQNECLSISVHQCEMSKSHHII